MFKALGTFVGRMFGSEKAMNTAVEGVKSGLDALFYTEQEKERDGAKERAEARSMIIGWLDKTQGQHIARRFLAMVITFTWLSQYFITGALNVSVIWIETKETAEQVAATAQIVGANADGMTGAMMLILGFYFAAPHIGNIVGPALARFGSKPQSQ